jgi:glycosyltransferase involved in cell wall biosynthesis
MRKGQNPQKARESSTEPPAKITVAVLNYIPEQMGYFKHVFDSLRLCLASIRQHAGQPFDLLVLDNGSCEKVTSYLREELSTGQIDYLFLNRRNVGKLNAVFQMLLSAPGDYVFYSDGDIYYRPGWMQAHLDIMKTYPDVGLVGGVPLRSLASLYTDRTLRWVEENTDHLTYQKGDLIPEEWTREFLRSIDQERYIEKWIHLQDCRVTYEGVTAYVGASHMQYLVSRQVIERIPRFRSDKAIGAANDFYIDSFLEGAGLLRLSTDYPFAYHIGNSISEDWLVEEFKRLVQKEAPGRLSGPASRQSRHWFWGRSKVRRAFQLIYEWAFDMYYQNA